MRRDSATGRREGGRDETGETFSGAMKTNLGDQSSSGGGEALIILRIQPGNPAHPARQEGLRRSSSRL